jgi:hypothetical protein
VLDHPDDERFETYLRQFRPQVPDPLPVSDVKRAPGPHFGLTIWVAGCVLAMVILAAAGFRVLNHRHADVSYHSAGVRLPVSAPLTMRRADDLLAAAPSYKAVMNELTVRPESSPFPKDKQSALAVLSKEKIKL